MHFKPQLLNYFLLLLFITTTVLCSNNIDDATVLDNPDGTTFLPNNNDDTTLPPKINEDTTLSKNILIHSPTMNPTSIPQDNPNATDVCVMSLVPPSEQNDAKQHQKCKCSNLDEEVDCSYLEVTKLPKLISFPKSARSVNFLGNKIENIDDDTFYSGRSVLELDLSRNHIDFISSVAFKAFKRLRSLDLSHNKIWNMPSKSFQGLSELKNLDLGYNDLVSISSDLFETTTDLRELILESNPLQELEPKLFEHLQKLEVLSLESTLLKVIPDHIFVFTPHLKLLDLSSNQLNYVPTDALRVLDHLKVLQLSGNPIHSIKGEAFHGLRGLVLLYLDRMPLLTKIEKYAFGDLVQLQELHCSYNFLLSEIDENAFVRRIDNKKIVPSQLFLRQNDLETLSKDLLNWNDNVELHIGENPLSCDCRIEWMVNLKLKNEFQNHAKCSSPSYLESMSLSQVKDHKLSCGLDMSEIVMIAVAVVVSILVLSLIVAFLVWKRSFRGYTRPYFIVPKGKHRQEVDYTGDDL